MAIPVSRTLFGIIPLYSLLIVIGAALAIWLASREEKRAELSLANTVSERVEDPQRLFDRFYRADESRSRETGGTGIGLSAAQAIVQLHKGSISAACEDGTIIFTVRLPLS